MNPFYEAHRRSIHRLVHNFANGWSAYDPIEDVWHDTVGLTWFERERNAASLHPVIFDALRLAPAANLYTLVREYPHAADSDSAKIAYTRNDADGERDRQTVTSAAKYLTRHFPTLEPHQIRDITSLLGAQEFHIWDTLDNIIRAVQEGPSSCMQWDDDDLSRRGGHHPYEVYKPEHGWRMAVRLEGTRILGRCLVNVSDDPIFVRSYGRNPESSYSETDTALEAWLRQQGYSKVSDWVGCRIARIECGRFHDSPLLPYIDGENKFVCAAYAKPYFTICESDDAEFECNNTDGTGDAHERYSCECCGSNYSDDDETIWAGRYGDVRVGPCCADEYRYVRGRRNEEYYIHEDSAVHVQSTGEWYDCDYLDEHNIVQLENGDYEQLDNCVEIDGEWYTTDDERVVWLEDTEEYALADDACWQCNESCLWYSDSIESVDVNGDTYHPDSAKALEHLGQQALDL